MPRVIELLAPAKNKEIGIAAIDCGADAVYIAGPAFGARYAAGNSFEDIELLCDYAHKFGARIFVTLNTILYDEELDTVKVFLEKIVKTGADAIIVQDLAILKLIESIPEFNLPLHASTQCAIRTEETAKMLESAGFSRLVLERNMAMKDILKIRKAVGCELEFFIHGSICVCYSGQCYISEYISGRSANRGMCIQACRSRYDLIDENGKIIVKNKALLSLKDYNLLNEMEDLAHAGICSFKIEGRLKNISYVKNVVREYSCALDVLVGKYPDKFCRASFGKVTKGFTPDLNKTFNRGYTSLFIHGKREQWASSDTPKGMGEKIGTVRSIRKHGKDSLEIYIETKDNLTKIANGDGLAFYTEKDIVGFRADICNGSHVIIKNIPEIFEGAVIFRNFDTCFEKQITGQPCIREIDVSVKIRITGLSSEFSSTSEDGRTVTVFYETGETALDSDRMYNLIKAQISKKTGIYSFSVTAFSHEGKLPFMTTAGINEIRRQMAAKLSSMPCNRKKLHKNKKENGFFKSSTDYKDNISNKLSAAFYLENGAEQISEAFEISHRKGIELMRMKYCIKYEIGMCPKIKKQESKKLFLVNNNKKFPLYFDCSKCEMSVGEPE